MRNSISLKVIEDTRHKNHKLKSTSDVFQSFQLYELNALDHVYIH